MTRSRSWLPLPPTFPEPSAAYVPVADPRRGRLAAGLAALAGVGLDGWQRMALEAGCDRRGGKWSAFEVGVICPRQNGKTVLLAIRELAGILLFGERLVIHSAHEWRTVSEQFTATLDLVEGSPLDRYKRRVRKTGGEESISFANGGRLRFMNRSRESARGFSADAVILDEAHAVSLEQAGALLPTLSARRDAQVWYAAAGPAPGAWQLARLRDRAMSADPGRLAWLEWSADPARDDLEDPAVWVRCNPAVAAGRLSVERMREERATLGAAGFAAERLAAAPWPSAEAGAWQMFTEADYAAMTEGGRPAA
jgi:phage terminase large subunit-like protein